MSIINKLRMVEGYQLEAELERVIGSTNLSAREVSKHLCGDFQGDGKTSEFYLMRDREIYRNRKKTFYNRLNMMWVVPLAWACAPIQYLIKGEVGVDRSTSLGRWLLRICGEQL